MTEMHDGAPVHTGMVLGGRRRLILWKGPVLLTALLLLIPALGNQFVDGWNWEPLAFVRIGAILFGLAVAYQLATRHADVAYRAALGIALTVALLIVWGNFIQFADGVNRVAAFYLLVPIVGFIGAAFARLRPYGMARALFVAAFAQALVWTFALSVRSTAWAPAMARGFVMNAVFALLCVVSAMLFRRAARTESAAGVA